MNLPEAKKLIAGYLTGARVDGQTLQEATEVVQRDAPDYVQHLRDELGLHSEWRSECGRFCSRLAEFAELSDDERRAEMPELLAHLEACLDCRAAYWELRPLWEAEPALDSARGAEESVRRLAEPIVVELCPEGVRDRSIGPPPVGHEDPEAQVYTLLDDAVAEGRPAVPPSPPARASVTWALEDADTGYSLHVEVCALDCGDAVVAIAVAGEDGQRVDDGRLRLEAHPLERDTAWIPAPAQPWPSDQPTPIELREGEREVSTVLGRRTGDGRRALTLRPGPWELWVRVGTSPHADAWIVPLDIR